MSKYEVKGVKSWTGRDGYGYECNLYRDGKKVARVLNEGNGGQTMFYWADTEAPKVEVTHDFYGKEVTRKVSPEEAALLEHVKGMTYEFYGETYDHSDETFVGGLVDEYEEAKQFKRWCRKSVVFRLKGDKEGAWRTMKAKYDERAVKFLKDKYGDKIEEILNERFAA